MANVAVRDTIGVSVSYIRQSVGSAESITAVFDRPYVDDMTEAFPVAARKPVLDVRLADLSGDPLQGDTCTVAGQVYEVLKVETTGNGCADLHLVEVEA